jgi:hypothetical protein
MFKISQFYDGMIKVEDAFPVRLSDNRLVGLSVRRFGFSGQRLARDRALRALTPRPQEEALCADSAVNERLPLARWSFSYRAAHFCTIPPSHSRPFKRPQTI